MAAGAACCYRPAAAGRASLDAFATSSPSLRPSSSGVFFISSSSSRWWMRRRRGEGKVKISSSSRARAKPMSRPALFSPVAMEWQECSTEIEVDVPCSVAYQCYSERETIPQWMPFISSVKILEDKPDQSRWTLKYEILGRDVEFSWLARNMTLTVAYEVPEILAPVASALKPFLEGLLMQGLERFATFAKERYSKIPQP
ncbi:unknown protein [Oryza sativa Japonica Group]|uniref:Coenzyme Q-binding protein COQ10 START domain-containing protein n=1 Tax=Oryza sativa subsp. japonica TaxID=39947 RepID=Q5ZDD7_ORYSJ|nr:unknown protein [Oryza sativa Japonica Group]BAD54703.1 unknown protein [Oryza sativa Japonica Group]